MTTRVLCFVALLNCGQACVLNSDPTFSSWPNKVIHYILLPGDYSLAEQTMIRSAMSQVSGDMASCLKFKELTSAPPNGQNYVIISKAGGPGVSSKSCFTYPGMITQQMGRGQYMALQGGPNGCLSSVRQVMRMLMSLAGLRFEYNKPNRDIYISVNTALSTSVATSLGVFSPYDASKVISNSNDYDYFSITNLDAATFSRSGASVLTSKSASPLYNIGRLSLKDCQCLSFLYSCTITCPNVYQSPPLPTQFTTATLIVTTGTTTPGGAPFPPVPPVPGGGFPPFVDGG